MSTCVSKELQGARSIINNCRHIVLIRKYRKAVIQEFQTLMQKTKTRQVFWCKLHQHQLRKPCSSIRQHMLYLSLMHDVVQDACKDKERSYRLRLTGPVQYTKFTHFPASRILRYATLHLRTTVQTYNTTRMRYRAIHKHLVYAERALEKAVNAIKCEHPLRKNAKTGKTENKSNNFTCKLCSLRLTSNDHYFTTDALGVTDVFSAPAGVINEFEIGFVLQSLRQKVDRLSCELEDLHAGFSNTETSVQCTSRQLLQSFSRSIITYTRHGAQYAQWQKSVELRRIVLSDRRKVACIELQYAVVYVRRVIIAYCIRVRTRRQMVTKQRRATLLFAAHQAREHRDRVETAFLEIIREKEKRSRYHAQRNEGFDKVNMSCKHYRCGGIKFKTIISLRNHMRVVRFETINEIWKCFFD